MICHRSEWSANSPDSLFPISCCRTRRCIHQSPLKGFPNALEFLDEMERRARTRSIELENAHAIVGGTERGRRYATQQINYSCATLLSSHFQGFCRDLHSECIDRIVAAISAQFKGFFARSSCGIELSIKVIHTPAGSDLISTGLEFNSGQLLTVWTQGIRAVVNCCKNSSTGETRLRTRTSIRWAATRRFIFQGCEGGGVPSAHWLTTSMGRWGA